MNNVESFRYSNEKLLLIFIILWEVLGIFLFPYIHFLNSSSYVFLSQDIRT